MKPPTMPDDIVPEMRCQGYENAGYVCVLGRGCRFRIEWSRDLAARLAYLQLGEPTELLHAVQTDEVGLAESALHETFVRVEAGEAWYELKPQDLVDLFCVRRMFFRYGEDVPRIEYGGAAALSFLQDQASSGMTADEVEDCRARIAGWCS